jgi:hypothetical protein
LTQHQSDACQLLRPGELVALLRPSVRRAPSSAPQQAGLVLEAGAGGLVVVVVAAVSAADAAGGTGWQAPQQTQMRAAPQEQQAMAAAGAAGGGSTAMDWDAQDPGGPAGPGPASAGAGSGIARLGDLAGGRAGLLLCGAVSGLRLDTRQSGRQQQQQQGRTAWQVCADCTLTDAGGGQLPLRLALARGSKVRAGGHASADRPTPHHPSLLGQLMRWPAHPPSACLSPATTPAALH